MERVFYDATVGQRVFAPESIHKEYERSNASMDIYVIRYARTQAYYGGLAGAGIAAITAFLAYAFLDVPFYISLPVMVPACSLLLAGLIGLKASSTAKSEWLAELAYNYVTEQRNPVLPEEPQQTAEGLMVGIRLSDGRVIEVLQPAPGELAAFIRLVLDETSGVKFTQNTARGRGWNTATYKSTLHTFKEAGLFMIGPNQVAIPTQKGRKVLRQWLDYSPTLPPQRPGAVVEPAITTTFTTATNGKGGHRD